MKLPSGVGPAGDGLIALIVNPVSAGGATGRRLPAVRRQMEDLGLRHDLLLTERSGHAEELAIQAGYQGYRTVVAMGGDGTFQQVVNGLSQAGALDRITFGVIRSGTGNDFARSLGASSDWREACRRLARGQPRRVDLGLVEYEVDGKPRRRVFVSAAGAGFDAAVVKEKVKHPDLKGRIGYGICLALSLPKGFRNPKVQVLLNGRERWEKRITMLVASNGRYFAGGMKIAPEAALDDGLLDMVTVEDMGRPSFLLALPRVYWGGHLSHPKVHATRVEDILVCSSEPLPLQADGELLGETPCRFKVLPAALSLIA